jgi:hypothetical protein
MSSAHHGERPAHAPTVDPSTSPATPAPAPGAAIRGALLALLDAQPPPSSEFDRAVRRAVDEGAPGIAESRERLAHTAERRIWMAEDAARAAFVREVAAYTCALRDDGAKPRQVLVAIAAVVREGAAPSLDAGALDTLVHDAGRYCVEAYFAR